MDIYQKFNLWAVFWAPTLADWHMPRGYQFHEPVSNSIEIQICPILSHENEW